MKTIAISSFKGGTAKTSTALNLGAALAQFQDQRVLLVDFDSQANLTTGLGFDPDSYDSMSAPLQGDKTLQDVVLNTPIKNLDLVPADTWLERVEMTGSLASDRYSHEKLASILKDAPYDYVIIDTPPSLCWLTESALIAADYALICATAEFYSIKGLLRLSQFLEGIKERHALEVIGVVLSFWNKRGKNNDTFMQVIEQTFPGKLLHAKVRRDISVQEASIYGKPVFETAPRGRAASDYRALTDELFSRIEKKASAV